MLRFFTDENGKNVVFVDSLSFLADRSLRISWCQRHKLNRSCKKACRQADIIHVPDAGVAFDVERYYFIPRSKIFIARPDGSVIPFI